MLHLKQFLILSLILRKIKYIDSNEYENLYNEIKNELNSKYLNQNLIDDKSYGICIKILNDIFNFYISGYPDIPDEYLYHRGN